MFLCFKLTQTIEYLGYDIKTSSGDEAFGDLESWSPLPSQLLPDPLYPAVVVSVWVPSMGQVDLFENYSILDTI